MKKKIIGIASALVLTAFAGVGCGKSEANYVYFGLGNSASTKYGERGVTKYVQTDAYAAAVIFDQDGKILEAKIDVLQASIKPGAEANKTVANAAEEKMNNLADGDFKTKWELGDLYGMKGVSAIGKEWYEQMGAYENFLKGKDLDEVRSAGYKYKDENHHFVPENIAGVSVTTNGYLNVLEKAWDNRVAVKVSKKSDLKVGVSLFSSLDSSIVDTGVVTKITNQLEVTVGGLLLDKSNVVKAARHDVYQIPHKFVDGVLKIDSSKTQVEGSEDSAVIVSKHELGPRYGMYYKPAATVGANVTFFDGKIYEKKTTGPASIGEWYEQANALVAHLVGKKVADVKAQVKTDNKFGDALASVSVTVDTYVKVYEKAHDVANDADR